MPWTDPMHDRARVEAALPLLGRIHSVLAALDVGPEGARSHYANYVSPEDLVDRVAAGTRRIRNWGPTAEESRLAEVADGMAASLTELQRQYEDGSRRQLVHGDFWDNNVLFRGGDVVLIGDFDFMGVRPRVDDLAVMLYFVSQDIADLTEDHAPLETLVSAYASGLDIALSDAERESIPIAMARQPLWSIAVWVALLESEADARRHLAATARALDWGLRQTNALLHR